MSKPYKLAYLWQADQDLLDAMLWYEELLEGLGTRLAETYYAALKPLENNPLIYQVVFHSQSGEVRKLKLDRFPYVVYYEIQGQTVVVIGLYHGKKNPTWIDADIADRQK